MHLRSRKVPARSGRWSRRARPVTSRRRCLVLRVPDPARRRLSAPGFRPYRVTLEGVRHLSAFLCHFLKKSYKPLCRIILRLRLAGLRSLFLGSIPKLSTPTVRRICRMKYPASAAPIAMRSFFAPTAATTCICRHHSHLGRIHPPHRWSSQKSRTRRYSSSSWSIRVWRERYRPMVHGRHGAPSEAAGECSGRLGSSAPELERSARVLIRQAAEALQELVALQEEKEEARVVNNQLPMVRTFGRIARAHAPITYGFSSCALTEGEAYLTRVDAANIIPEEAARE